MFTLPPRARQDGLFSRVGYVEDLFEPRTQLGNRRVLARLGWAGVMVASFSILPHTDLNTARRSLNAIVLFFNPRAPP